MNKYSSLRALLASCAALLTLVLLGGCASTAEGITRALMDTGKEPAQRQCSISGAPFGGIEGRLDDESGELANKTVRVVLVHGIGTHEPGWSIPLIMRLADQLNLNSLDKEIKKIKIVSPKFEGESLGQVGIMRLFDKTSGAELLAYELSWSEITQPAKQRLAYDTAGFSSDRRAAFNQDLKVFMNDRLVDPVAYLGPDGERIRKAAAEVFCMSAMADWRKLPSSGPFDCNISENVDLARLRDEPIIAITHSLGSRIMMDVLRGETAEFRDRINDATLSQEQHALYDGLLTTLQQKTIRLYMMANQLPLIDAAVPAPKIVNQIPAYCEPDGEHYPERILEKLSVVAFSDPNDLLSYGLPLNYASTFMDSRLCPTLVNVSLNVTDVLSPLGLVEIAPPLEAHAGYEQDDIVLSIIAGGVGKDTMKPQVAERCDWINIE
jgi:hypothetical protein